MDEVYVFDYDGVIADPVTHEVNEGVIERIGDLLIAGHYVAFNTGRSLDWFELYIVPGLVAAGVDDAHLVNLAIVTEKGGEFTEFVDGVPKTVQSENKLAESARNKAAAVFESMPGMQETMDWTFKNTMVTAAKKSRLPMDEYLQYKFVFEKALEDVLEGEDVKLDIINNATDIQHPDAGKYGGTKYIYDWVARRVNAKECRFICLGDSKSDYDMPRYVIEQGCEAVFVFTGQSLDGVEVDSKVELIKPVGEYTEATMNYFRGLNT
jgi:hydroxymethylpyrimidine pyrophosphatase-like HAD family hydrolase